MTDEKVSITLVKRDVVGKQVKNLRRDGQVPAVIHDHGQASVHVMAPYIEMQRIYQRAGKHHPVEISVGDKKYLALIKDAHFEPRKNQLQHIVFNAVDRNQTVEAEVPVVFTGENEAEKVGLLLLRQIDTVQVEAIPANLPDELTVDIGNMKEVGDRLHVSDIVVPANITMLTELEHAVAVVDEPRAHAAEEAEEAETAEAAEGEPTAEGEKAEGGDAKADDKKDKN
jgi:large subunit ribosomal protein L25